MAVNECNHIWRESFLSRYCVICEKEQSFDLILILEYLRELRANWSWKQGYPRYEDELKELDEQINSIKEILESNSIK